MSRNPDDEKRKRILQVSLKSFCEIGYKKTTIKTIADMANIAPGTIYTYYSDKNNLYNEAIEDIWSTFFKEFKDIFHNSSDFTKSLNLLFDKASALLYSSHSLLNDMYTNKVRKENIKKNLTKAAVWLAEQIHQTPAKTALPLDPMDKLAQKIEMFLYGAFFQLAFSSKSEFESTSLKIKSVTMEMISGICL